MTLSELYEAVGGDIGNVLERLGDMESAEQFLQIFLDDSSYSLLMHSLQKNDIQRAFRAAHNLKGVSLSLGLNRLGECSAAVCQKLREGIAPSEKLLQQLTAEYRCVITAINHLNKN